MFIKNNTYMFSVEKMCKIFDISRSSYYAWLKRPESKRKKDNSIILAKIKDIRKEPKKDIYGYPRIHAELNYKGYPCGKNRVARIMQSEDIKAKTIKRYKVTTNSKHKLHIAKNLLKQDFSSTKVNEIWTSDITYIWTKEGWLYLAIVLDVFSREIVGWSMDKRMTKDLVISAIKNAIIRKNPPEGIIFHSDRGSQYASNDVRQVLKTNGFKQSMSGSGNCYDNAITETFFHSLKTEHVHFEFYESRYHARASIFDYIETFYNRERRHSSLGYLSPKDFMAKYQKAA